MHFSVSIRLIVCLCCAFDLLFLCLSGRHQPDASEGYGDLDGKASTLTTPEQIGKEIARLTEVLTTQSTQIFSSDIIEIQLSAPNVPDLTVIDLPGISHPPFVSRRASICLLSSSRNTYTALCS